ncbi:MAG: CvpA family protein [Betaproteobacteria bacterium]|nr:CvpA family protein [Betaproteobacteria bacterium]
MAAFDLAVAAILALSVLFAVLRGFVRSAISLGAWVIALVLALRLGSVVAEAFTAMQLPAPAPQVLGFVLVFLAVVIGGALLGTVLAKLLQAVGPAPSIGCSARCSASPADCCWCWPACCSRD